MPVTLAARNPKAVAVLRFGSFTNRCQPGHAWASVASDGNSPVYTLIRIIGVLLAQHGRFSELAARRIGTTVCDC